MSTPIPVPTPAHPAQSLTSPPGSLAPRTTVGFFPVLSPPSLREDAAPAMKPLGKEEPTRILLLENVSQTAVDLFERAGFEVQFFKGSLSEPELIEKIKDVHAVGIRSKSLLTPAVLNAASKLLVAGAFCIGTNQIDLKVAAERGVPVFNSPFSNSRSVGTPALFLPAHR